VRDRFIRSHQLRATAAGLAVRALDPSSHHSAAINGIVQPSQPGDRPQPITPNQIVWFERGLGTLDAEFDFGLERILDGLAMLIERRRKPRRNS